jgi:hypothetical protein
VPKLNELFEKVAEDRDLQAKYVEIIQNSPKSGEAATHKKLIDFAKDVGYDITIDEMKEYLKEMAKSKEGELPDSELDKAAGGSILTPGIVGTVIGGTVIGSAILLPGPGHSIKELQDILDHLFK